LLIAVAMFMVLSGVGLALMGSAVQTARANSQAARVAGLIELARANAIRTQRDLELTFDSPSNTVRIVRNEGGVATPLAEVTLEYSIALRTFDDIGDTPDAFGNATPTDFGDAARLFFISDGSLVDEDSLPANGTIFLGTADEPASARAITITGATARARRYRWMAGEWVAQ
jgi:type II secretory pathway pseudopilin PulG